MIKKKSRVQVNQPLTSISLCLLGLLSCAHPTISALPFTEIQTVRRADEFIDSIGIRTEFRFINQQSGPLANNPYKTNFYGVKNALMKLGVKHVRNGADCSLDDWPSILSKMKDYKNSGIKFSLVFSNLSIPKGAPSKTLQDIISGYRTCLNQVKDVIEQVEGLNEPDANSSATVFGLTFPANVSISQKALWTAVKSSAAPINRIPVLAPSLIGPYYKITGGSPLADQLRGMGKVADFNNLHTYYGGEQPDMTSRNCRPYTLRNCPLNLDSYLQLANFTASTETQKIDLPAMSTEAGYRTSSVDGVPESLQEKYIPRILLYNFNYKVKRTYIHELIDSTGNTADTSDNWGILRFNLSPKPAYTILKNMIAFLSDPGSKAKTFKLGSFMYKLEPATKTSLPNLDTTYHTNNFSFVKSTFLQKSNGKYYIILWNARSSWDNLTKREINNPPVWVRVSFPKAVSFKEYVPTNGTFGQISNGTWLGVYVEDYPKIIEVKE